MNVHDDASNTSDAFWRPVPALRFRVITVRDMERRRFLLVLAAGLASASAGHGVSELLGPDRAQSPAPKATPETAAQSVAQPAAAKAPAAALGLVPVVPPAGAVDALPGDGTSLALTIDDGTNSAVVAAFATFAADTGVRLTFFPNGRYRSWQDSAPALCPLVESGQVARQPHLVPSRPHHAGGRRGRRGDPP